jgi:hypothetical protein
MNTKDINEIFRKPLLEKLQDMQKGLEGNIDFIYQNSLVCADKCDMVEYARANGQIWGLQFAKGMLDAILRLEDRRVIWDKAKESDTSE